MAFVDFAELKASLRIEDSLPKLGLTLKKRGEALRGPCPTCRSGGDRALVVTPAKQAFYCFGARTGGDVIALAAHIQGIGMKEAAAFLAGKASERSGPRKDTVPEERTKEAVRSLQPLTYLEPEHPLVQAVGLDAETCRSFGAGYAPKGILRGRLAVPIHDRTGTLIAYCGRALKGEEPKLTFPKDFDPAAYLWGYDRIDGTELVLVRDPLDALIAAQNGIGNLVSLLTETIGPQQLRQLSELMEDIGGTSVDLY